MKREVYALDVQLPEQRLLWLSNRVELFQRARSERGDGLDDALLAANLHQKQHTHPKQAQLAPRFLNPIVDSLNRKSSKENEPTHAPFVMFISPSSSPSLASAAGLTKIGKVDLWPRIVVEGSTSRTLRRIRGRKRMDW
jgi:hypothetical protein